MSDILRRIAKAQGSPDNPFTTLPDGKVIELTDHGDVFTGYYKNDDGVYYTEADWLTYQREQEAERLAQVEWEAEQATLAAAREERARKLAIAEKKERKLAKKKYVSTNTKEGKHGKRPLLLLGSAIVVIVLAVILWPDSNTNLQNTPDAVIVDTVETDTIALRFGDAVITGSDVRMRSEPSLEGKIVTYFPKQGERVELLQAMSDTLNWAQVRRENGTTGWVFGEYVKVVKSNE